MQLTIEFCIYEKYVRANALKIVHIIGASLSEPHLDEMAGAFLWYIYIYLYPWAHLVPRRPRKRETRKRKAV